ncbi:MULTISPECIES: ABC transporter substrate-binding protein [unclassified Butyrivibrio]|uniref:ABC transporter substrate-binding protein n=1 Tax=unclassified Butyrivibrio TaxID=2639466 RepID=UPI0008DEEF81|nr:MULTISPECIES: extracellular solute-binding protein [unclassified Butyrivibrio]RKM60296.1 extracellular solute-binding protein [Butyrivibrio sp. XB500-5]SFU95581.1 oligogalacturonide transport system substrate-binding protein [Butyrivibrio sp. INlla21]
MTRKKLIALVTSVAMLAGVMSGCGISAPEQTTGTGADQNAPAAPSAAAPASDSSEPVTLRFSWWGGDARHEATLAVIEAYEKLHPNVTIEPEYGSYDGYSEKKTTEFASGTAPDIFQIETGLGPEYYNQGVLYNLTEGGMDFSNFDASFLEENGQFGSGAQYAMPTGQAGTALIVNKTLMDKVGIDLSQPYDWDQFFEWGKKVREYSKDCYLLSANTSYASAFFTRTYSRQKNNKPIIDDDYNLNMTEEQFVELFTYIKRLYDEEVCAPAAYKAPFGDQDQEDPNWIKGNYVASIGYTSSADVLSAANDSVDYIAGQLPLYADRKSDGWVNDCPQLMGVYAGTQHAKEAIDFLNFFYNDEGAMKTLGTVRSVPPTAKAQEICAKEGTLNPLTKQSVEVSMQYNGKSDSGPTTGSEVTAILTDAYENISHGTMSPEEAAKETMELLKDFCEAHK